MISSKINDMTIIRVVGPVNFGIGKYIPASYHLYKDYGDVVSNVPDCTSDEHMELNTYYELKSVDQKSIKESLIKAQNEARLETLQTERKRLESELADLYRKLDISVPDLSSSRIVPE